MSLSIRKLTSRIGALVEGADLTVLASVDGRRSRQLVGDVWHYSRILETAA